MKKKPKRGQRPPKRAPEQAGGTAVLAPPSEPAPPSGPPRPPGGGPGEKINGRGEHLIEDVMVPIQETIDRMQAESRRFQARVEEHIRQTGATAAVKCPIGGPDHFLDVDATCGASWRNPEAIHLVYRQCAKCLATALSEAGLQWLHRAGAPRDLLGSTFENWLPRLASDHTVLRMCREFAANPTGFLVLSGGVGLGKTHLSVAIMRVAHRGRFLTQSNFLTMLRATYHNDNATDPVAMCKAARLLVLDELGVSGGGRDEFPALYEVLNFRYGEGLPTVFTTNVPVPDFDSFGDRIADRLATSRIGVLKGESWRRPKAAP